jgi:hypothetical protein
MFRRFISSRRRVAAVTTIGALVVAAAAFAYFTSSGSGTGSATVGSAAAFTYQDTTVASPLYPGQGSEAISGNFTNSGSGNELLNTITVTITAPTVASPAPAGSDSAHPCSAGDFTLSSTAGSGWTVASGGQSAVYTPANDLAPNGVQAYGGSSNGLSLSMVDQSYNQNNCQGAKANFSVAASS